jgi:hypothetical protein
LGLIGCACGPQPIEMVEDLQSASCRRMPEE